jgi:hypothetical protein
MVKRASFVLCALIAGVVAACSGTSTSSTPTTTTAVQTGGTVTLNSNSQAATFPLTGSLSGIVTYPSGTGSVTVSASTSLPSGLASLESAKRAAASPRAASATSSASPTPTATPIPDVAIVYITVSGTATLNTSPGFVINSPTTVMGTPYQAIYNGTTWVTVGAAGTVTAIASGGSQVNVAGGGGTIAVSPAAPAYFVVYTGVSVPTPVPTPTPTPTPTPGPTAIPNLINDSGFEASSGAFQALGSAINATGWTQCTVSAVNSAISYSGGIDGSSTSGKSPYTAATAPPITTFTPIPMTTPGAVIAAAGATVTTGSHAPTSTIAKVPAHGGSYAAQFGQLMSTYNSGDYRYNGLCQSVTIPAGMSPNFSAYVLATSNDANTYVENIVGVLDSTMKLQNILYMENVTNATYSGDTAYRAIGPVSFGAYSGQTITLFIGMWTKDGSSSNSTSYYSYWFVDDVLLQ